MKILNGWKQIAAHLNQGVRTVQRWEVIGLPVHRLRGTNSPVIAFAEELNDWAEHAPVRYADLLERCNKEIRDLKREVTHVKREVQRLTVQKRKPSRRSFYPAKKSKHT
jgi:uncharacterized protein YeaO (DUF488 family)